MKTTPFAVGELDVLSLDVPYVADPTELYSAICGERPHNLLLESAEIDSKEDLKSLMLIDAAVRIVCRGREVHLEALTENGVNVLEAVKANVAGNIGITADDSTVILTFETHGRAIDEDSRLRQSSPFDALRLIQQIFHQPSQAREALFLGGLFAYDLVASFEPLPTVEEGNRCPDYLFYVAETLLIVDHQRRKGTLQATLFGGEHFTTSYFELSRRLQHIKEQCLEPVALPAAQQLERCEPEVSISDEDFCQTVEQLKEFVVRGDVFQVVPSRHFRLPCPSPLNAYKALKIGNPSPYMFYLQDADFTLFGASPESALKYCTQSNQVEIYPIAGTRPRGKRADGSIDLDLDGRIELELRCDKKENAEHMMLVDLARNDVARISQPGTRYVADLLQVDRYSHVMHLVSRVVGQLRDDLDALHAYQACMNMGTLTGAPKIRAMQLIRDVEQQRRGSYGGAVGYLTGHGDMDTCIVIRSAYVEDGIASVQAGAGVVYDSVPQAEADETRGKAQAVITAIRQAHSAQ
ncbi:anthranilate synthase component 1 [Photobacterium sp. 1_MG-2023]|uniref:anthranilate synthase component 1 n=1 Tax=Photobacterium sp. 1_MG-2023 TaxID=3062646 RepID=UPI0026E39FF2|nr:anthranilate synthase component 1 [Photobacterium sp. 1_MG-2023]MDO6706554.1 anthranilate synthase component 1 [Photobacterium sp. 1_MG-2023]